MRYKALTIVGHAHRKALMETAILALVAVLFLNPAPPCTLVVLQFETNGSPEEPL